MTLDLDHLSSLCAKATPGPWEVRVLPNIGSNVERPDNVEVVASILGKSGEETVGTVYRLFWAIDQYNPNRELPDADFIAAARTALPELIARVRGLEAVLAEAVHHQRETHDSVGHPLNPPLPAWVAKAEAILAEAAALKEPLTADDMPRIAEGALHALGDTEVNRKVFGDKL